MAIDTTDLRRLLGPTLRFVGSKLDVVVSAIVSAADRIASADGDILINDDAGDVGDVLTKTGPLASAWQAPAAVDPAPHAETHENGGDDEIDVTGLSGVLGDDQKANKIRTTTGPTLLTLGGVADGEYLVRSGATIIGGAGGGGGGSGNPYIDCLTTVDPLSDEFDSGSPDLATRGWTVYNRSTGAIITRSGGIMYPDPVIGTNTYRSTLYGSRLVIQTEADGIIVARADTLPLSRTFALRVGIPKGNLNYNSGSSSASIAGAWQAGMIRSQATLGTIPWRVSNNFHAVLLGGVTLAQMIIGYEEFAYSFNRTPTDSYSTAVLSPADTLVASVGLDGKFNNITALNAETGAVCGALALAAGGEKAISGGTGQVGFQLWHTNAGGGGGAVSTFTIDYFRVWSGVSWFGL